MKWTTQQDDIIRKHYPKGGPYACWGELNEEKTINAIRMRATALGVKRDKDLIFGWQERYGKEESRTDSARQDGEETELPKNGGC